MDLSCVGTAMHPQSRKRLPDLYLFCRYAGDEHEATIRAIKKTTIESENLALSFIIWFVLNNLSDLKNSK